MAESVGNFCLPSRNACPSCGNRGSTVESRKYVVTSLRRCRSCELLFRAPTTSPSRLAGFHSSSYRQGTVTDIPPREELEALMQRRFRNSFMDYSPYINALKSLNMPRSSTVLELGCSWGYGCWQMQKEGLSVMGVEVSPDRAEFARSRMGVEILSLDHIPNQSCDVFFSSHVLEHIPNFSRIRRIGFDALRTGGYFVAITPNGCRDRRKVDPAGWRSAWGFVHPLLFDDQFLRKEFGAAIKYMGTDWRARSSMDSAAADPDGGAASLEGAELMFIARKR